MSEITIAVAALAGLGSFLAPCILPVIPAFLAYISGTTITDLQKSGGAVLLSTRLNVMINTVFFVLGFSIVFSVFGVIINSVLASTAEDITSNLNQIGGLIIVGFGVFVFLSTRIRRLNFERRFLPRGGRASYPLSFVFGLAFATAWTPCIGPILGSVLTLAATAPSQAFVLLIAYSLGLGIPFIVMGAFFSKMSKVTSLLSRHMRYFSVIMGALIIVLGMLVLTDQLAAIASFPLLNDLLLGT